MKTFTLDESTKTVDSLENLIDEIGIFLQRWSSGPTPTSRGVTELKSFQCSESVMTAYSQGLVSGALATDQTRAFIRTVVEPAQTFAPWTCVRAVLESSALGAWLLDPDIDVRTRVQRSFALRYEGLEQAVKCVRVAGTQSDVDERTKRIDVVEQEALNLGYPKMMDKLGKKRIGIGQLMPGATALVTEILDREFEYRLFSGIAHGHLWALLHLGLQLVDQQAIDPHKESEGPAWSTVAQTTSLLEQHIRPNDVVYLSVIATTAFTKPFWYACQLFGWDTEGAKSLLEKHYRLLNIQQNCWFWKTNPSNANP
jgi:hypothetical protein